MTNNSRRKSYFIRFTKDQISQVAESYSQSFAIATFGDILAEQSLYGKVLLTPENVFTIMRMCILSDKQCNTINTFRYYEQI